MPRARMIKPEFCDDEKLSTVSRDARLTFISLWIYSDDYGTVKGNHKYLMSKIYPYDDIDLKQFSNWMKELELIDCIRSFDANGESYYYITHFNDHQTINKPSQTRNPTPPDKVLHQCSSGVVALPSEVEIEVEVEREVKKNILPPRKTSASKKIKFSLPDNFSISDEVKLWAEKHGHIDLDKHLEAFIDLCRSNGYTAVDWDSKFKRAIREDWGKIHSSNGNGTRAGPGPSSADIERARQWAIRNDAEREKQREKPRII